MPSEITILHLSDMQFGKHHRFGWLALPEPDAKFDTLLHRLTTDLDELRDQRGLRPDIIVASGDLVEWGKRTEFQQLAEFLDGLTKHVGLKRDRVVVVPGNHDINRASCLAYFAECDADDIKPVPPFWPKWRQYHEFFQQVYLDQPDIQFTEERPYTLFPMPDLGVIVAGLNSTMAECHDLENGPLAKKFEEEQKRDHVGHFGRVGESQLNWFAEQLKTREHEGLLRIGVVHHNVMRKAGYDNENLKDADDLERLLGPQLNLILHGHTHVDSKGLLDRDLPVLATGSTALAPDQRPDEVPNQYQLLRLQSGGIERIPRRYEPDLKHWVDDTRIKKTQIEVDFKETWLANAAQVDDATNKDNFDDDPRGRHADNDDHARHPVNEFAQRVNELASLHLKDTNATVETVTDSIGRVSHLRVTIHDGHFTRVFPIGAFDHGVTPDDLEQFLTEVDSKFRITDPQLTSEIVYGGERAEEDLIKHAARQGVRLKSFIEYQGLIDFRPYTDRQTKRLAADPTYPPSLYVTQKMLSEHTFGQQKDNHDDAFLEVVDWLTSTDARFILVLGDFGTGKTFLLHELARRLPEELPTVVPVLIEMRELEKGRSLDQLIAQHLATAKEDRIDLKAFRYMLKQGRIALLFDGFDELAGRWIRVKWLTGVGSLFRTTRSLQPPPVRPKKTPDPLRRSSSSIFGTTGCGCWNACRSRTSK